MTMTISKPTTLPAVPIRASLAVSLSTSVEQHHTSHERERDDRLRLTFGWDC